MKKNPVLASYGVLGVLAMSGVLGADRAFVPVTDAMLLHPDPADWLMPSRTYDWQRFSPLGQINRRNVGDLRLAWVRGMGPGAHQNIPIVYRGVMYVVAPVAIVHALDAATGDVIWEYRRALPDDLETFIGDRPGRSRNLAIYEDSIFYAAPDGYVVALDARTGQLRWAARAHDYRNLNRHTSGPIVVNGKVLTGRACFAEPCFITAHDARTGQELWRTYTAAAPGEPGGDTWGNLPFEKRLNSPWGNPGSFDPVRGLVYWGVANPKPYTRLARHGSPEALPRSAPAELYSNSTIALDPDTGRIVWYYQHLPGDDWDADHVQERLLVETPLSPDPSAVKWINPHLRPGEQREIMLTVGEPGGIWALDRDGQFLWALPFPHDVPQFHLSHIDGETGRTYINWDLVAQQDGERVILCFHNTKSYWPMAYHPERNALYVPYNDYCVDQTANLAEPMGTGPRFTIPRPGADPNALGGIARLDVATGQVHPFHSQRVPGTGAVLVTAGDLLFWGDLNRRFRAFDADTGRILWEAILGDAILNSTITYAVDGRQYVAVLTGRATATGGLLRHTPEVRVPGSHNAVYVFALPETP